MSSGIEQETIPQDLDLANVQSFALEGGGYDYYFIENEVYITTTKIKENNHGIQAELNIDRPPNHSIKGNITLNIADHRARYNLAIELAKEYQDIFLPWDIILNHVCSETIIKFRTGEPVIQLWTNLEVTPPSYYLKPLIAKGEPNLIFAEQSSGKTILTSFLMIKALYSDGIKDYGLTDCERVKDILFLDYENNENTTLWNLKCIQLGLELPDVGIHYRRCFAPLRVEADSIRDYIRENRIQLTVTDSLGIAAGGDLSNAESAINYYSALRGLSPSDYLLTHLILAHTSKAPNQKKSTFGSIYFENLARNIWEMQKVQVEKSKMRIALHHKKPYFSHTFDSLGYEVTFDADKYYIETCEPEQEPEFVEKMPASTRIISALQECFKSTSELSVDLMIPESTIRGTCRRLVKDGKIEKGVDGKWNLI